MHFIFSLGFIFLSLTCSCDAPAVNATSKIPIMPATLSRDMMASGLSTICLLTVAYAIVKLLRVGKRSAGLPPGPRTLPIIGNLHLMPTFKPYKKFAEWGKTYGPIYSLMVGSNPLIVLQSQKIAKDLLDKRGSNYSSRPDLYILSDLASRGLRQVAMVCRAPVHIARVWTQAPGILKLGTEVQSNLAPDPPSKPQDLERQGDPNLHALPAPGESPDARGYT